jgi:hypothetical protein
MIIFVLKICQLDEIYGNKDIAQLGDYFVLQIGINKCGGVRCVYLHAPNLKMYAVCY